MKDGRRAARSGRAAPPPRRRFALSPDSFKMPLAILGGLLILGAAGYYMIFAGFDTPMRIMLAAGILLVGIAIAIDPEAVWGNMTTRGALYGGNTLAVAAIFLGILALLNVLGARRSERWDLTASKQFSLSGETAAILQQAQQPIQLLAFFQPNDPQRQDYESLLKEYALRSDGKLTYEFVDPIESPALAQQYAIRELGTSVLLMGDRRQQITGTREADLTTGLLKLVQVESRKAYFTIGHNERSLDASDPDGYGQLRSQLEGRNFVVEPLTLLTSGEVPADASIVVVGGPRVPFGAEEVDALSRYLGERNGRLMVLLDPQVDAGLGPLLAAWNIEVGQRYVVETDPQLAFRSPFNPVVARFANHRTTEQLLPVLFPAPTYLNVAGGGAASTGPTVTQIAQTSQRSWAEADPNAARDPASVRFDEGQDLRGPLTVALVAESRPDPAAGGEGEQAKKARLVVVGTSRLVTNEIFQLGPQIGNVDLFVNAATWLAGDDELVSIQAKPPDNRTLFLTGAQQNFILVSSVLFLPALVLAAGVAVWWSRR